MALILNGFMNPMELNVETMILFKPSRKYGFSLFKSKILSNLNEFKQLSYLIIVNRHDTCLNDEEGKVYMRDFFKRYYKNSSS